MEFPPGKFAGCLAADVDCERRRGGVKKLLGVIIGKNDPEIRIERTQPLADVGGDVADMRHQRLVLGIGHGEELRRVRQHGAADHGRHHGCSPFADKAIVRAEEQQARRYPAMRGGASHTKVK